MELFKVCAPPPDIEVEDLYIRTRTGTAELQEGRCMLSPNSEISTDTYFNVFSSSKYAEYTKIKDVTITTNVSGKLSVELRSFSDVGEETIETAEIDSEKPKEVRFSFNIQNPERDGTFFHYLVYHSYEESVIHSFGSYISDLVPDEVELGIVICTFNREERVIRTLDRIDQMMSDERYGLKDKITVFVVDNGRSLDKGSIDYDYVRLIPNRNTGGSGGFTKGIMESRKNKNTHILLMDDDIEIDPNVVYKTFNLISVLNEEHKEAFVLGGMLLPETPNIQYEAGAEYLKGFRRGKHMLDLSDIRALLQNDEWVRADYGGWWYMCMPESAAEELPLPLFIKLDDVEFGLRRMKDHIIMNGIGIWHDSFESKTNPVTDHYFLRRNTLILYSMYGKKNGIYAGISHLLRMLHCIKEEKGDEYLYTRRAVNDFLKGPEFIEGAEQTEIFEIAGNPNETILSAKSTETGKIWEIFKKASPAELLSLLSESIILATKWNGLAKQYRRSAQYLSSQDYWDKEL
jgi:GT2 family glycosyltransferase